MAALHISSIFCIVFIPLVGLGPPAGALAIGIHSIGTLGKLTSEAVESIEVPPVHVATVRVVDSTGSGIGDATVGLILFKSDVESASATTDDDGRVAFCDLMPGRYTVRAEAEGRASRRTMLEVIDAT